jgi:hypothetical protein
MIFNKNNNGNEELRNLTGNYYLNNKFGKIETNIELATEELIKVISYEVYKLAEDHYRSPVASNSGEQTEKLNKLVQAVQLPIAIMATLQMYQKNDISHQDDGRKVKIDTEHEKLPWEWQLKRDDAIHLDDHYKAVDRLIAFLDRSDIAEWENSGNKQIAHSLFIRNAEMFDLYFPIEKSGRMFMLLLPFIREVQRIRIKPALGSDYQKLLAGQNLSDKEKELLEYVYPSIPLFAMAIAIRRMPLGLIPAGIVRNYISNSQTMNASEPASLDEIKALSDWLEDDALTLLNDMKQFRNGPTEINLLPHNCHKNKYMIV